MSFMDHHDAQGYAVLWLVATFDGADFPILDHKNGYPIFAICWSQQTGVSVIGAGVCSHASSMPCVCASVCFCVDNWDLPLLLIAARSMNLRLVH